MLIDAFEVTFIKELVHGFPRSPRQLNSLQGTDAEIVEWPDHGARQLAVSTDSIIEEISSGLYDDPYLVGWMTVMASLSDLAAVGSVPIGLLISEIIPHDYPRSDLRQLQQGIADACIECETYIIGGDTNCAKNLMLTATALGTLNDRFLTRSGARPGDLLYSSGQLGGGNAYALAKLRRFDVLPSFMPIARLREGQSLTTLATACMDTSDGTMATLDQLMHQSGVGFELNATWDNALRQEVRDIARASGLAPWLFLAGQHGEFELLFTIPPRRVESLLAVAETMQWQPLLIGRAIPKTEIRLPLHDRIYTIDTTAVRNFASFRNIEQYVDALVQYDKELQEGAVTHA